MQCSNRTNPSFPAGLVRGTEWGVGVRPLGPVVTNPTRAAEGKEQDNGFGSLNVHSIGNAILRQAAEANEELRKNMTANISDFMRSGATLHRGGATLPQCGSLGALGRHGATLLS